MLSRIDLLKDLAGKTRLTPEDALAVRRWIYADGAISQEEAELLFRINDAAGPSSGEWRALFVEALTDFLVHQQLPAGYLNEASADWLLRQVAQDGRIKGPTELELLIRVQEVAQQAPPLLSAVALHHVENAIMGRAGDGLTINDEDVNLLRRILFAFSGDGGAASVSRLEAELLFRLNDRARGRPNAASWRALFAQAIGQSMLVAQGYRAPDRDEALRREAWLREGPASLDELAGRFTRGLTNIGEPRVDIYMVAEKEKATAQAAAATLNPEEATWLLDRIGRDGELDDNERALLDFLREQTGTLPPELARLVSLRRTLK